VRIEVAGIPAPQGSKRHVGGGRMVEQSRAVGPWREAVRAETQRALEIQGLDAEPVFPIGTGVSVAIWFTLPKPKSAPKRDVPAIKRPDVDKLARAVLDGIVAGGAIIDDAQVVRLWASKAYAGQNGQRRSPGCVILLEGAD
jgi:crossover junction endodeoxyribonuclease RusA